MWGESEDLWEDGEEMKEPRELADSKKKVWKSEGENKINFLEGPGRLQSLHSMLARTKDTAPPGVSLTSASRELRGDQQS